MATSRTPRNQLGGLFDAAVVPIYVLDEQRRVIYCNSACATWLGVPPSQVVGLQCAYHSAPVGGTANRPDTMVDGRKEVPPDTITMSTKDTLATWLCPPPEVFSGEITSAEVGHTGSEGPGARRCAYCLPLGEHVAEVVGVVVVLSVAPVESGGATANPANQPLWNARELHEQLRGFHEQQASYFHLDRLVGRSPVMRRVREQVHIAVQTGCRTLIMGPPGSGREHVARTIYHATRSRASATLMPLDCSLLDAELLEATMTSHVRRWSELVRDTSLTILLLEVDQLPLAAQGDLCGYLAIPELPLRVLATSRRSLWPLVESGEFRRELALAISPLTIELPSLSERREDIPLLAQYLVEDQNRRGGRQLGGLSPDVLELFAAHDWPGNIAEMSDVIRQSVHRAEESRVMVDDLPETLHHALDAAAHPRIPDETIQLDRFLAEIETELIRRAMQRARGNKAQAARLLGVHRARLLRKLGPQDPGAL